MHTESRSWHYVCTSGLAAAYYFNKNTLKEERDADGATWPCFYPWTSGDVPEHIPDKSGRSVMSDELINGVRWRVVGRGTRDTYAGKGRGGRVVGRGVGSCKAST